MKYELGIENAYVLISKFHADDRYKFYPFHEHAAQLERFMHINADLSFRDATVNCVNGFNMAVTALQKTRSPMMQ